MPLPPCETLKRQGYQFFSPRSSAAVKPCLWCKAALTRGEMCYKHQFYGIDSHRCVQMTPTLRCTQRCLFCWRSFEHQVTEEEACPPEEILRWIPILQKKALSGFKVSPRVPQEKFQEALNPRHVALSLAGEPTLYPDLPRLLDLLNEGGYTTFLVSNGTRPEVLEKCHPYQQYISLCAPDEGVYRRLCRPVEDSWEAVRQSLSLLGNRRSAIRITLVAGWNDRNPAQYGRLIQDSAPTFVEVKSFMYLGYSRKRLRRENMPEFNHVQDFAHEIAACSGYRIADENAVSRVVLLRREG
ncbi:MAG: 4-demethylwyosine synthase TYW1 [Methanomicrobiales archaeon]|nr:4-demethylwyosine synthase TYW1 [Methanomicrobiales archaeon]